MPLRHAATITQIRPRRYDNAAEPQDLGLEPQLRWLNVPLGAALPSDAACQRCLVALPLIGQLLIVGRSLTKPLGVELVVDTLSL